ncbi:hypothetical protein [Pelagimonas varians]|uniref:Uncharacterized protein n=1 Tax=Pelagimonas varians TaxID=696760 RepID=A0A238KDV4_9RHOB|nr:hypothetical protein [Pelagimonas varians]PYG29959.1 hypothetical protein C8N36_107125 [Pelagimonas varians]SMX40644.1 hypothetical protein PEV8663_02070 [Pelagimonas varians]
MIRWLVLGAIPLLLIAIGMVLGSERAGSKAALDQADRDLQRTQSYIQTRKGIDDETSDLPVVADVQRQRLRDLAQ